MQISLRSTTWTFPRAQAARLVLPIVTAGTLAIAFAIRGRRAFTLVDFPLNDGGMFYAAIEDIRHAAYALPMTLSYNGGGIPFAYPPLAFYLSALVQDLLGITSFDVLRLLPVLFAGLIVVAYVPLARALSTSAVAAAVAVFVVAVQPSAYTWMVMGGGLTRALGITFAVAALVALHRYYTTGSRPAFFAAAALSALTLLSHIEMAWFLSFSALVFLAFYARDRARAFAGSIAIGAIALAATAPWWLTVLVRWGPEPFIAAATTGSLSNPLLDLIEFRRTDEPYFPIVAALGVLGLVVCAFQRRWAIPMWLLATAILDARSFNALSALQLGLLAGIAVTDGILPLARDRRVLVGVAAVAALYAMYSSAKADQDLHRALTHEERAAMTWVAGNTPADATFVVVTQRFWAGDRVAEWLPALTGRRSLDTVQGTEWLPKDQGFWRTMDAYNLAQQCGERDGGCLLGWANEFGPFDYVYLPKTLGGYRLDGAPAYCCGPLRSSLRTDPAFTLVYDGVGATIFRRIAR